MSASHPAVVITIVCLLFFVGSMVTPKLLAKKPKKKEGGDTQAAKAPEEEKTGLLGDGHDGQDLANAEKGEPTAANASTELIAAKPAADAPIVPENPIPLPSRELEESTRRLPTSVAKVEDVNVGKM